LHREYKPDDKPKDIGEPIDAPEEPQVDHGAIVQSYLTDPESRLVLRKDDTADKMLSVTKFNDKNTLLGSVLSDIASRMLTKTNVEDRVANFASRIADLVSQEGEPFFKPDADYPKNKKIAIQLARRYIDDYNKMKKDPAYADQVRMDPAKFNPKKDLKGKAKETEAFENWVNNIDEYAKEPKDQEDKDAKLKALQDIQMDPNTAKDSELADKMKQRKKELMQKTFPEGLTFEDIKPYVSMYKDPETGKMTNDVLDKDGNSVFKTTDAKVAMAYLSKNFAKMRSGELKGASKEEAQEEAQEINSELDRITTLANYK
jgi:hypothetical protein